MTIRPKIGEQVKLNRWQSSPGDPPTPPTPWTGVVVQKLVYPKRVLYNVRRDHDGREVTVYSGDMAYLNK